MANNKKILIEVSVKDNRSINKTRKSVDELTAAQKKLAKLQKQEAVDLQIVNEQIKIQEELNRASAKSALGLAQSKKSAANSTKQFKTQAGLNNAILLETSRLASDAGYGFTAMANNLGQVVSLFFSFSKTAGGALASLKQLAGSLLGTGGLLIAVQLLIAFGDDIYNFFTSASEAANKFSKSLDKLKSDIQGQRRELLGYIEVLKNSNTSEEVRLNALKELEAASPGIVDSYDKQKTSLEDLTNQVEEYIKQQRLRGELDALIEANSELFAERERIRTVQQKLDEAETNEERKEIFQENISFIESIYFESEEAYQAAGGKGFFARFLGLDSDVDYANLFKQQTKDTVDEYDKAVKRLIEIESQITARPDDPKSGGRKRRARIFRAADLDFEKERQQSRERILKASVVDEKAQIIIQMQGVKDRARIKTQEFKEDQKRRLDQFIARGVTQKEELDARKKYNQEIRNAEEELASYLIALENETKSKINNLTLEQTQQQLNRLREQSYKEQELNQQAADQEILNEGIKAGNLLDVRNNQLASEEERIRLSLENDNLTFKQREALEKQYTQVTNEQTKLRIEDAEREALSKRQLTEQVGNALTAFSSLAGKETEAGKKLAIAGTLVSTYSAAQKAFESQFLPVPTVNSPIRGALAAAAAIASGLANVRAIQSGGKSAPSKAKPTVEAPDFNVVGASPESQLAQTVAGQQSKPLKAFVVGKEITSQQELDRNITTNASLGD